MGQELFHTLLALIAITMAVTPLLTPVASRLADRIGTRARARDGTREAPPTDVKNHVLIAGFGRGGETVATLLERSAVPYVALEQDAGMVTNGRAKGFQVYYGDARQPDVLRAAGAGRAMLAVVTLDQAAGAEKAVAAIRYLYPRLPIEARARDLAHSEALQKVGATSTVVEYFEGSLQLGRAALLDAGVPEDQVSELIEGFRREDYRVLRESIVTRTSTGSRGSA